MTLLVALRASTRSRTSLRSAATSNGRHLERDELRLAVLVVDPALDEQDAILLEQVAGRGVGGVEDDHLDGAGQVVEPHERHRVALAGRDGADRADDAADRDDVAVAAGPELRQGHVGLAPQRRP